MADVPNEGPRWRGRLLVIDDAPDVRADAYVALADQSQYFEIETSLTHGFQRLIATSPPYTLVFVPLTAAGRIGPPDRFVGEAAEEWARRHAPGYAGRFVYYGAVEIVNQAPEGTPTAVLPAMPSDADIERFAKAIDDAIERVRLQLREQRKAEREAKRLARQAVGEDNGDAGESDL